MADKKTTTTAAVVLAAAFAAGAGADRLIAPPIEINTRPLTLRMEESGFGLDVGVKIGAGRVMRILNWDRKGGSPLLDGQTIDDKSAEADARVLGECAVKYTACAEEHVANMTSALIQPPRVESKK